MELTNWKTAFKKESWGLKNFGIEIRISIDRPFTEQDSMAMDRIGDQIEEAILTESIRLDPEQQAAREEESRKLMECFAGQNILATPIPNGYCPRWCCTQKPWYRVTTRKGIFTIGWRKRVISIEWDSLVGPDAETVFPDETPTKFGRCIHAYGYEKAKEYVQKLLNL